MRKLVFLFLFVCVSLYSNAQTDVQFEEAKIEEFRSKTYTLRKVLPQYLKVYRLYDETNRSCEKKRILNEVSEFLASGIQLFSSDAMILDSLQNLAYSEFKDEDAYLSILENVIESYLDSKGMYEYSFELYDRAVSIRKDRNLQKGAAYEKLLRWYVGHIYFKKSLSNVDRFQAYSTLWDVYQENRHPGDSIDIKLLDSYAMVAQSSNEHSLYVQLLETKKEELEKTGNKKTKEWYEMIKSLSFDYGSLADDTADEVNSKEYRNKELSYRKEYIDYKLNESPFDEGLASVISIYLYGILTYQLDTLSARTMADSYLNIVSSQSEEYSEEMLAAVELLSKTYSDYDKAKVPILQRMLSIEEVLYGKDDIRYKGTSSSLDMVFIFTNNKSALIENISSSNIDDDPYQLMNLGSQQYLYGKYIDAIATGTKLLEYAAANADSRDLFLYSAVLSVTNCYSKHIDYSSFVAFIRKWSSDVRFTYSERKQILFLTMGLASLPGSASEDLLKIIDEFILQNPETSNPQDLYELKELKACVYFGISRYDEAERIYCAIAEYYASNDVTDIKSLVKYRTYQEICLFAQDKIQQAYELNILVQKCLQQVSEYEKTLEYRSLCCRACIYMDKLHDMASSSRYADIVRNMRTEELTSLFPDDLLNINVFTLHSLFLDESSIIDIEVKNLCKQKKVQLAKDIILGYVSELEPTIRFSLSHLDQSSMLQSNSYMKRSADILMAVAALGADSLMNTSAYDYLLLYKQSFLSAENSMRMQMLNSGDQELKSKFTQLQSIRSSIQENKKMELPVDDLQNRLLELQQQVIEDSKMYGDFTCSLNVVWEDIKNDINDDEMALEFVDYTSFVDDDKKLGALVITKNTLQPEMLELCSERDIEDTDVWSLRISQCILKEIISKYPQIHKIYFAPSGVLHNIPIESLPMPDGNGFMCDKYEMHRVSSTREILRKRDHDNAVISKGCLYGGLNYDMHVTEMIASSSQCQETTYPKVDSDIFRGSVNNLPFLSGTKTETEQVASIFTHNNIPVMIYQGNLGTEESVLSLNGTETSVLHLATHGFYLPEAEKDNILGIVLNRVNNEDDLLSNSGLFLSGAQNAILGDELPSGIADGILTAQEISTLDLHSVQLVTLSACQTALGSFTSDGIFGLQRGLKKAGVKSILMSLWNVDDAATCVLMTEFYNNWISKHKTKHDALEAAKMTVRKTPGWENPKYWASFVLLDGID